MGFKYILVFFLLFGLVALSYLLLAHKIYKLKYRISFSVLILAIISNAIWYTEVILRDWTGLAWIKYEHIAFYILFLLFALWLLIFDILLKCKIRKIAVDLAIYGIICIVFVKFTSEELFWSFFTYSYLDHLLSPLSWGILKLTGMAENNFTILLWGFVIIVELVIILICNVIFAVLEKQKLTKKIFGVILFPLLLIPVYTPVLTFITVGTPFELGHWLKTGSIIFSVILYECTYIAYIKTKYTV